MTPELATYQLLELATRIGTPLLLATLTAGMAAGLLQAVIQVQEASLGLVARLVGMGMILNLLVGKVLALVLAHSTAWFLAVGQ